MMPRIYFFCVEHENVYQDDVVVLADGLQQLGAEVHGNCHYWRRSTAQDDWLIRPHPTIRPENCDIVVVSSAWSRWLDTDFSTHVRQLPAGLFAANRTYRTAYLDVDDGYATAAWQPAYAAFDAVFRAKYNHRCYHPKNQHPWVLGLNHRMLDMTVGALPWKSRRNEVLVNFGASHPYEHSARAKAGPPFLEAIAGHYTINSQRDDLRMEPKDDYDRLMWRQTQHRHCRHYYERLNNAQAVAAFCGELIPPAPFRPYYLAGGQRARFSQLFYKGLGCFDPRAERLIQWDSWRFWEALAAGCLVFNLDLSHYGVRLPVMPIHMQHYIAIRPGNAERVIAELERDPNLAERIAAQGHAWAMEHYSPAALARRFLSTLVG